MREEVEGSFFYFILEEEEEEKNINQFYVNSAVPYHIYLFTPCFLSNRNRNIEIEFDLKLISIYIL